MSKYSNQPWLKQNPALNPIAFLLGEWELQGAHPLLPNPVRGRAFFGWSEGGAFLLWRTYFEQSLPPDGISVINRDESTGSYSVLYLDERGVSRIYEMSFDGDIWKLYRNVPGFMQCMTGKMSDDRNTITVQWELSKDGSGWEKDLNLIYTRIKK